MNGENHLKDLAVSDTGFLFDPYTGATFTLNASGRAILEGLKNERGRDAILASLKEEFEVSDGVDLHRDLDEFLMQLRQNDLLSEDADVQP